MRRAQRGQVEAAAESDAGGVGELGVGEGVDMVGGAAVRVVRESSLSIPEGNEGKRYRRGFDWLRVRLRKEACRIACVHGCQFQDPRFFR